MMDMDGKLKSGLAQELESLHDEIVQLQSLFLHPSYDTSTSGHVSSAWIEEAQLIADVIQDCPLGMALTDRESGVIKANRAFCHISGYSEEEICSLRLHDLAPDPDLFIPLIQQIFDGTYPATKVEGKWLHKNGESFWIKFMAIELSGERRLQYCLIAIEDIREQKAAEQKLESEKKLLACIVNSSVDGIAAFDCDGFFTIWNPGMERIFGISARETLGRPVFLACPFFKALGEDVKFDAALRGEMVFSTNRSYTPAGGNQTIHFEGHYGPICNSEDKRVIGGLAIFRDVANRGRMEESSPVREDHYGELFENASDMMFTCSLDGAVTAINRMGEKMLGYSREEVARMRFSQFMTPEYLPIARHIMDQQMSNGIPVIHELEMMTKGGDGIVVEASSRLIFHEGKPCGIQSIVRNIGERKRAEQALVAANRKLEESVRELEQRTRDMTLLGELGDILCACLTIDEIYDVIVRISQELFPSLSGALFVLDPLRNIMESAVEWGGVSCVDSVFTLDECWALRRGKVHWVDDTRVGLVCKHVKIPTSGGFICIPMMAQSNAVGVLHLSYDDGVQMSESKRRLAMSMAEYIATALSNLRMYEIMRSQSIHDPLTGLFNRSFMEKAVELELCRASRTQNPLSFIMLSVDRFRHLHEDFDLDVTDSIVRKIGALLQSNIRKGDIACRFSDDTFIVVLPQTPRDVGLQRAEMFCNLAQMMEMKDRNGRVSISVGAAMYPEHGPTVDMLLRAAETAVSRAGQSGGNCVVAAG